MQRQSFGLVAVGSLMQTPPAFWSQPCMLQFSGSVQSQGCRVGAAVGATEGNALGDTLGDDEGAAEGLAEGLAVGASVGLSDGLAVGVVVSAHVCPVCLSAS